MSEAPAPTPPVLPSEEAIDRFFREFFRRGRTRSNVDQSIAGIAAAYAVDLAPLQAEVERLRGSLTTQAESLAYRQQRIHEMSDLLDKADDRIVDAEERAEKAEAALRAQARPVPSVEEIIQAVRAELYASVDGNIECWDDAAEAVRALLATAADREETVPVDARDDREVEDIEKLASSRSVLHWGGILRIIERMRKAEAALAAQPATPRAGEWRLVPVEPTEAMKLSGSLHFQFSETSAARFHAYRVYQSMIKAAPPPPRTAATGGE